jgi:hypothetical protein
VQILKASRLFLKDGGLCWNKDSYLFSKRQKENIFFDANRIFRKKAISLYPK